MRGTGQRSAPEGLVTHPNGSGKVALVQFVLSARNVEQGNHN